MEVIKQYTDIHPEDHLQSYAIKRMEDLYAKFAGQADDANRKHILDFTEYALGQRQVHFVSPGQVHQIVEESAPKGFVLTFSQAFLMQNGIEACFIEDLHLFQDAGESPPLEPTEEEWSELKAILQQIEYFAQGDDKFKDQGVGALLKLFLIRCNNSCTLPVEDNTQVAQASVSLLRQFKSLVETHYQEWHKVQDYAQALHITADYLNTSVKSLTGKSAKEHIQRRVLLAAQRSLQFSHASTKEIAFALGFTEPANFSQFFKRQTGQSPSLFRG